MMESALEQLRPGSELFVAQVGSIDKPFQTLAKIITGGDLKCKTPSGAFQLFDPDTEFLSTCAVVAIGALVSLIFGLPILYRIVDLSRHERGKLSVQGQLSKVAALLTPIFYLTWLFVNNSSGSTFEWIMIVVGLLAAILHHVQEGRVTVCSGELLVYWLGLVAVYLGVALETFLSGETNQRWLVYVAALLATTTFVLEITNDGREKTYEEGISFDDASVLSKISLSFANKLVEKGGKDHLTIDDFPHPPLGMNAVNGYTGLENALASYEDGTRYRLLRALFSTLKGKIVLLTILDVSSEIIGYAQPSVLGLFLGSLAKYGLGKSPLFASYYFAILLGITPLVNSSLANVVNLLASEAFVGIRVSLTATIYRKVLKLHPAVREKFESSKIMNLISVDANQINGIASDLPTLVSAPVGLFVSVSQLWLFLGPSMFAAVVLYTISVPLSGFISTQIGKIIPKLMEAKDERNKLTSNAFRNIKSLKLYAWEKPFYERIKVVREQKDLKVQKQLSYLAASIQLIWNMMGDLVGAAVFTAYLYLRAGVLSPEIVFPSLLLLQYATMPFTALPMSITSFIRCVNSQNRIDDLLLQKEQDYVNYTRSSEGTSGYEEPSVIVDDATISWNGEETEQKVALKKISFKATRGDLVCIIGRVGSGKTALLKALAGELSVPRGGITVKGSLAYCSQEAWLQNQTLRSNILFGQKFQEEWYERVIEACELSSDIAQMPKGDQTDVGERGISLSGGQKARVALARAVYSRADVYLLDDVLSAVDEHVSAALIKKLFGSTGLLANRTIILATNNVKVLSHSSLIYALENKTSCAADSFADVVHKGADSKIYCLVEEFGLAADLKQEAKHIENRKAAVLNHEKSDPNFHPASLQAVPVEISAENVRSVSDDDEEKEETANTVTNFKRYFRTLSPWISIGFLMMLVFSCIITNSISIYLGFMSNQLLDTLQAARWYIIAYLTIVVISAMTIVISALWCNVVIGLGASNKLHNSMVWNLMHAPMSFFDATPLGRLINRFTSDIALLDSQLPNVFYYTVRSALNLCINLISVVTGSPLMILVILPLSILGNKFRKNYVPSSRKVTRMASAANSPILSHIEESLKGQALLRSFDRTQQFIEIFEQRIDYWIRIGFVRQNLLRWLGFRIQAMTAILTLCTAISVTYLVGKGIISIGYGAVILHFASRSGVMIRQTLDFLAQIEVNGVSLGRILEYVDAKQEAPSHIEDSQPPSEWPSKGEVSFKELSARYTPDGPDVLKNLSLIINAGEKVGIVGRTGSGKSSLTMTIFRILEAQSGHIEIDGADTSKIGLFDLRSKLSIIPQDAQIFDGTLRENLDPLNQTDDAQLWDVLELCHLKDYFKGQELGLDTVLTDSGENLSRGQSQLVCLGRALIHKAKILVLDEATASVDVETDKIVQETIRKHFGDRTIITIAHRLNTIMDSDRIIVLDGGEIREFDTPANLVDSKGLFYKLLNAEKKEHEVEAPTN